MELKKYNRILNLAGQKLVENDNTSAEVISVLQRANSIMKNVKQSGEWRNVLEYLNENEIEYEQDSSRGTAWTDFEMYIYYLQNNKEDI